MIRGEIGMAVLVAATIVFLLAPSSFGAGPRRALAVMAVRLGAVPLGAGLLQPLARAGDAIAENDLGVLLLRGGEDRRDPIEAARLLNAAAASGLARAELNLLLVRRSLRERRAPSHRGGPGAFCASRRPPRRLDRCRLLPPLRFHRRDRWGNAAVDGDGRHRHCDLRSG